MKKIVDCARLDLLCARPGFAIWALSINAFYVIAFGFFANTVWLALLVGAFYGVLITSSTFVYNERYNFDSLCILLAIEKKRVVQGKYALALFVSICSILVCLALASLGVFFAQLIDFNLLEAFGVKSSSNTALQIYASLAVLVLMFQTIQFPIFFKLGYAKAKNIAVFLPVGIFLILVFVGSGLVGAGFDFSKLAPLFEFIGHPMFLVLIVLLLAAVILASLRLSIKFYKAREF